MLGFFARFPLVLYYYDHYYHRGLNRSLSFSAHAICYICVEFDYLIFVLNVIRVVMLHSA